ncbi:MAG: TIM-barrel domain-containing protein [Chitinophagaceae bacterium]
MRYIFSLLLFINLFATAQQPIGNYQSGFTKKDNSFSFTNKSGKTTIEFCTSSMFRVRSSWSGKFEDKEPWMVIKYDWSPVKVTATEKADQFLLTTTDLQVKVFKSPFRIEVYTTSGKLLSADAAGNYKRNDTTGCTKRMQPDEHFFGFGERMDFIDQRNKQVQLNVGRGKGLPHIIGAYDVLQANYCPIPFFMSTKGYGIFFHNAYPTTWDMGAAKNDEYSFRADGGELDYYFIYGPKLPAVLEQYTLVTGRSPLLPKFALGLHMGTYSGGTWGYEQFTSDQYVINLARKLREMGIYVDILWLDSTWRTFGKKGGKGATSFEWRETFKDPKGMFDSLYKMNYKMVGLHLRPRFDNGNFIQLLDTAQKLGYTYPEKDNPGDFVNFFDSASVDFWWKHGVMRVGAIGAKFLKTDEGSAFGALANESDKVGPTGKDIARLHNIFPLAYAKAPYEKFQSYNGIRGLNHTREGYAGIQRYPFIFAGDWPSEWQYFEPVIKAGLNVGMSGVGYWTNCMGGFEHLADPELYMRWCQFGMLGPLAMVFGMDHPGYKEPWAYGDEAFRNFKKYDSLRSCLLPYLYSTAYQQYKTGLPIMRSLVLHYQDDPNTYTISDQYMLGDNMMVCPVTTKGAVTRTIYFPEGIWYDYWTGKKIDGKKYLNVVAATDVLPVYIKAGGIVPMQPFMKYTDEKPLTALTLQLYAGNGSFNVYEDDGQSLDYQSGAFSLLAVNMNTTSNQLAIHSSTPKAGYKTRIDHLLLAINGIAKPTSILQNNKPLTLLTSYPANDQIGYYYNEAGVFYVNIPYSGADINVVVRY